MRRGTHTELDDWLIREVLDTTGMGWVEARGRRQARVKYEMTAIAAQLVTDES
jgi:hypothetical protein